MLESFVHSSGVSAMVVLILPCAAEWYQMFLQWQYAPAGIHWLLIWSHCAAYCCGVGTIVCLGIHGFYGNADYLAAYGDPAAGEKCPDDDGHLPWLNTFGSSGACGRHWCICSDIGVGGWTETSQELAFRLDRADGRRVDGSARDIARGIGESASWTIFWQHGCHPRCNVRVSMFLRGVSKAENDIHRSMYRVVHRT